MKPIYDEKVNIDIDSDGNITGVKSEIKASTMHLKEYVDMIKKMPESQRRKFEGEIKFKGIIPIYGVEEAGVKGSKGRAFKEGWTALNATKDETDWFFKRHPEYSAEKKTGKDPRIIIK